MKRFFSLILACTLLVMTTLPGCTPQKKINGKLDPKNPTVVELWHYYNGPQKIAFDSLVDEFNNTVGLEKGITIETFSQGNVNELAEKVIDAANKKVGAGEIPDIFAAYADTAFAVDRMGLVSDLEKHLTPQELDEYVGDYVEEGRLSSDKKLKIFPVAKSTEVMMLNKTDWDKFSEATGASVSSLETMEGLTATAKTYYEWTDSLTAAPDDGRAFFGRDAVANYFVAGCKQLGSEIFTVENGKGSVNTDESIMKKLWDNFYIPTVNGYFGAYGKFRSDDAKTGDIIALVGSTSGAAYFPDQVVRGDEEEYPIEAMALPAPIFAGGEKVAIQQGAGMVVTKSDETKELAAVEFLKWFTQEERNIDFSIGSGYLPVKKAANDIAKLQSALDKLTPSDITENLAKSLPVAVEVVSTHELYTSKAFENGTAARAVLEKSMSDKAKQDLKAIESQVAGGMSRREAAAAFDTEENFKQWLGSFRQQLADVL